MKIKNYNKPESIWRVTNRTKRAESNYKGWNQAPKKQPAPAKFKSRWVSRQKTTDEED